MIATAQKISMFDMKVWLTWSRCWYIWSTMLDRLDSLAEMNHLLDGLKIGFSVKGYFNVAPCGCVLLDCQVHLKTHKIEIHDFPLQSIWVELQHFVLYVFSSKKKWYNLGLSKKCLFLQRMKCDLFWGALFLIDMETSGFTIVSHDCICISFQKCKFDNIDIWVCYKNGTSQTWTKHGFTRWNQICFIKNLLKIWT